jgi:hypothetical protein
MGMGIYETRKDTQTVGIDNLRSYRDFEFLDNWSNASDLLAFDQQIRPP